MAFPRVQIGKAGRLSRSRTHYSKVLAAWKTDAITTVEKQLACRLRKRHESRLR